MRSLSLSHRHHLAMQLFMTPTFSVRRYGGSHCVRTQKKTSSNRLSSWRALKHHPQAVESSPRIVAITLFADCDVTRLHASRRGALSSAIHKQSNPLPASLPSHSLPIATSQRDANRVWHSPTCTYSATTYASPSLQSNTPPRSLKGESAYACYTLKVPTCPALYKF